MQASSTTFNLLRHGQVDGPAALYGKTDVSLSEQGLRAMQVHVQHLPNPDVIITSPRLRCQDFAENLADTLSVPLIIEDALQECDFGLYDGIPFDDLTDQWLELNDFWRNPMQSTLPEAESLEAFHHRVHQCWQRLITQHQGQNCLVICHGGVIRQILASVLAADWQSPKWYTTLQIGYASVSRISIAEYQHATPVVNFIAKPPFNEQPL
ncbi:Putative phosphoserine phosphatase 2 [Paraglaciecola mesophila]|uniref:Phosphoserine phosphatase 2 n=1 Tax=Paraglaciecola mesophila TaxID=197222 RepID=A0A857JJC5_9ALTE|nr:histidine phosphatase family protein [Paraglaciecola mesophila]QHJ11348.1 Putative phosphoserine phosphatase 2 [Paraglaciecola mesophila]